MVGWFLVWQICGKPILSSRLKEVKKMADREEAESESGFLPHWSTGIFFFPIFNDQLDKIGSSWIRQSMNQVTIALLDCNLEVTSFGLSYLYQTTTWRLPASMKLPIPKGDSVMDQRSEAASSPSRANLIGSIFMKLSGTLIYILLSWICMIKKWWVTTYVLVCWQESFHDYLWTMWIG